MRVICYFFVAFLLFSTTQLFGQSLSFDTLARWNFNGASATTVPGGTLTPTPHRGTGNSTLVNGPTGSFVLGNASTSANNSSDSSAGATNFTWSTTNYPFNSNNTLRGYQFNVSTANRTNIRLSFDMYHSATASRFVRLEYSTNGVEPGRRIQDSVPTQPIYTGQILVGIDGTIIEQLILKALLVLTTIHYLGFVWCPFLLQVEPFMWRPPRAKTIRQRAHCE